MIGTLDRNLELRTIRGKIGAMSMVNELPAARIAKMDLLEAGPPFRLRRL